MALPTVTTIRLGPKGVSAGRCLVGGHGRLGLSIMAAVLVVLAGACTSPERPHPATTHGRPSTPAAPATSAKVPAVLKRGYSPSASDQRGARDHTGTLDVLQMCKIRICKNTRTLVRWSC